MPCKYSIESNGQLVLEHWSGLEVLDDEFLIRRQEFGNAALPV